MSDVLPLIRALEACTTDAERALWLLTADLEIFVLCELSIRQALRQAGFLEGVDYLEKEVSALRRARRPDGRLFNNMELAAARGCMERLSLSLPPCAF